MNLGVYLLLCFFIVSLLFSLKSILLGNPEVSFNSSSSFECGFNLQSDKNIYISGQFFMTAIIFVIFDLEISLFIPLLGENQASVEASLVVLLVLFILFAGVFYEWGFGMFEWVIS
uniref:NADH dehydrogenase subunit 3 n=1 Tax=Hygrobates turcicus TaxID=2028090 RepID=UPI002237CA7B|nr:NADH dehydrogenase subunit 3 [Hygrobates turcicus]UYS90928.1 NADH dehydrogenase subunit 3 [Hygrobates turcicus]